MEIFQDYARYYNLLYRDKDYKGEAQFVHQVVRTHAPETTTLLELGCGTGNHAFFLAENGYEVHGVDLSTAMIQTANERCVSVPQEFAARLTFSPGDVRDVRIDRTFDAVISLFHVINYQVTDNGLHAMMTTAKAHLRPGGIFLFDFWYGPAVLTDQPTTRVKRVKEQDCQVIRVAEPVMQPNDNVVEVHYQMFVENKSQRTFEEFQETHRVRYLFMPEIKTLLRAAGLELIGCYEWMTNREPGLGTWGVYCIARG